MEKACKEHPYHNQKQGVCPSCLRDKLSQIYATVATNTVSCPSSMSCSSSVASTTHMSPIHHRHHQRTASDILGSISFKVSNKFVGSNNYGLKKSRSVAFVSRNYVGDVKHGNKNKKKKGFWSKLLHLKEKKDVNLDGKIPLKGFSLTKSSYYS